jgi:hypothetical protein
MFVGLSFRVSRAGRSRNNTLPECLLTKHRNHDLVQIVLLCSSIAHSVSFLVPSLGVADLFTVFLRQSQVRLKRFTQTQAPDPEKEVAIGQSGGSRRRCCDQVARPLLISSRQQTARPCQHLQAFTCQDPPSPRHQNHHCHHDECAIIHGIILTTLLVARVCWGAGQHASGRW